MPISPVKPGSVAWQPNQTVLPHSTSMVLYVKWKSSDRCRLIWVYHLRWGLIQFSHIHGCKDYHLLIKPISSVVHLIKCIAVQWYWLVGHTVSMLQSMASSEQSDTPITLEEYLEVKRNLAESQARVAQLVQTNRDLKQEITLLHNMVRVELDSRSV